MTEKKFIIVRMPYPGDVISVNHYRGRIREDKDADVICVNHYRTPTRGPRDYVRAEAQAWMDMLGWVIKTQHIEDWSLPIHVTCSGCFKDGRSAPDLSNLSKCILDAIQAVTGINDRDMRWHDGNRTIDKTCEPEIIIKIEEI